MTHSDQFFDHIAIGEYNMMYSKEERRTYGLSQITYGIIEGSNHIVFVKVGRGGTVWGENASHPDVYFRLAQTINRQFGYTVIVSDNPQNESNPNPLLYDMAFVDTYATEVDDRDYLIEYIGFSAGANYGAWYGHRFPKVQRMLLINPMINLNTHRMKECCRAFAGTEITFLVSALDPSAGYASFVPINEKVRCKLLQNENHILRDETLISHSICFLSNTDHRD